METNLTAAKVKYVPVEEQLARDAVKTLQTEARRADAAEAHLTAVASERNMPGRPLLHVGARRGLLKLNHTQEKKRKQNLWLVSAWKAENEKSNCAKRVLIIE